MSDNETRDSITIAGKTFSVIQPYAEGHVLTANEASTLNQTYAENVRNNFAKRVKDAVEKNTFDQDTLQLELDQYMDEYEFGVRTGGGGRTADPVEQEAMDITRQALRDKIKKSGASLKDYKAADITKRAKEILAAGGEKVEKIYELAKQRVAAAQEVANAELV